jgi:hypothetical protein
MPKNVKKWIFSNWEEVSVELTNITEKEPDCLIVKA